MTRSSPCWRRAASPSPIAPEALYARFAYNVEHTYPNRIRPPAVAGARLVGEYAARACASSPIFCCAPASSPITARPSGAMAWPLLRAGRIEDVIHVGLVAHHLINFARDAVSGAQNASFYSSKIRSRGTIELEPADLAS